MVRSSPSVYVALSALCSFTVLVWLSLSHFGIQQINGWLPYHVPVTIFLASIVLVLAVRAWVKVLPDDALAGDMDHGKGVPDQVRRIPAVLPRSRVLVKVRKKGA
ncbi:MAG TPA: hypothetical protein VKY53_05485 [Marinobacter sp.]|nr:hypothetical protein [Marinobacter sp.]